MLVLLILVVAGFIAYRNMQEKKKNAVSEKSAQSSQASDNSAGGAAANSASGDQSDQLADQDFNAQCENGEWVKIADVQGDINTLSGTIRPVDPEGDDPISKQFKNYDDYLDGSEKIALINSVVSSKDDNNNIDLFQGRESEVQGVVQQQGGVKTMNVSQIRCTGKETDKNLAADRVKMLNYISQNIATLAPEKPQYQKWSVDSAIILDDKDVYVDYYDTIEDADNADPNLDTMHRLLLEVSSASDGSYTAKVQAYYVPGENDFSLKSGKDKFSGQDETIFPSYTYDAEENSWTRD